MNSSSRYSGILECGPRDLVIGLIVKGGHLQSSLLNVKKKLINRFQGMEERTDIRSGYNFKCHAVTVISPDTGSVIYTSPEVLSISALPENSA